MILKVLKTTTIGFRVNMRPLLLIVFQSYFSFSGWAAAQTVFQAVDEVDAREVLTDFVENRERFRSFGCAGTVDCSRVSGQQNNSLKKTFFCNFEDAKRKKSRSDWSTISFQETDERINGWATIFKESGKSHVFSRRREVKDEFVDVMLREDWQPTDPWSWAIIDISSLGDRKDDALLWTQIFQEEKLLWAEDNGAILRAEWSVGPFCRVQCYFDKKFGNLPTYCRYIWPIDLDAKFGKKSKVFLNEIETSWARHEDGWVPVKVRNYREDLDRAGKVRGTEEWNFQIDWKSPQVKDGAVDPSVFIEGKMLSQTLFDTFSEGTQVKKRTSD